MPNTFISDLEKWYEEKESMFEDLNEEMVELTNKMDLYITKISSRSKYYIDCVS